jgi:hypothetical protein
LWCAICHATGKHTVDNCHLLQKFVQTPQQLFCNFYKSVGHDECNCRSYELMMDKTPTYRVQSEIHPPYQSTGMVRTGFQGRRRGRGGGGPCRGRGQLICYNRGGPRHYVCECTNPMRLLCKYCTQFDHETEGYPMPIVRIRDTTTLVDSEPVDDEG